jgi:hypothetical protein
MNTGGQQKCIDIFNSQPRPLTPDIVNIVIELDRRRVKDPKQYLQSFLTMDYYGLFWIIIYILLVPVKMDDIDSVFRLRNISDYKRIYKEVTRSYLAKQIFEKMPTEYNSNSMIMKFVELVLQLKRQTRRFFVRNAIGI